MATNKQAGAKAPKSPNPSEPYATGTNDSTLQSQLDEASAIAQAAAAQLAEIERLPQRLLAQALAPESWLAIIDSISLGGSPMSSLIVRNVDDAIVKALKSRAARHGRSTEAEHRAVLAEVLLQPRRRSLAEVLAAMPNVGEDADFARVQERETSRVFD